MNLLPFIIIIIMVLSLFSLSQFEGALIQKKENQIYLAYFKGLREARNEKEKIAYKKTLVKNKEDKKTAVRKGLKKKRQKYFREHRLGWEKGKLNLSSLLVKPDQYPSLETVAVQYVKQLYGSAEFFHENDRVIEYLIKALIKERQKRPSKPLHAITFGDPKMQDMFYKMMRGTHSYDLKEKGYPPFEEMFTFEKSDRPPMNYHYANLAFLSVVFGQKTTKKFVELENKALIDAKKKYESPIKKPELENFLRAQRSDDPRSLLALFDFTYQPSERVPAKYRDSATEITVKVL
ncbi:MAG: hypothetical protein AAGE99_03515 [Chlamydiota bacterium]